ncbi:MAG: bifunctional adenosylcobinamide kinase/adenosylcobinamide-phosphate guanylyltransferase [Oscillospiraceae bacterium]
MMVLISGGSGSGKSEMAERLLVKLSEGENLIYLATMKPFGQEAYKRILRHQELRKGRNFSTIEVYQDLENITIDSDSNVLLECMSNLLANEMFCENPKSNLVDKILYGVERLKTSCKNLVIVSNEIFSDGCNYDTSTVEYIKTLGIINQRLAKVSNCVIESIYSNPIIYKGSDILNGLD